MLPFLYPAGTRRYLCMLGKKGAIPRSSGGSNFTHTPSFQHHRFSDLTAGAEMSDDPSASKEALPDSSEDPLGYLLGEASPEEEESLKPKRRIDASPFSSGSGYTPGYRSSTRSRRGRDSYAGAYSGDEIADDPSMNPSGPRGNLTEREKVIFDRIFDRLLNQRGSSTVSAQQSKGRGARPSPVISALFESAVGPQRSGDEVSFGPERAGEDDKGSMQAVLSKGDFPASLRYAAAGAMGLSRKDVGLESDENSEKRLVEYREAKSVLDSCKTDLEIWEFLDTHVFPMAMNATDPAKLLDTTGEKDRPTRTRALKEAENGEMAIPSSNYPKLLHNAIFTLRTAYRDFPACVAVFEKIKRLGPESYIIGCSKAVYNEMLVVRWKGYRDIQSFVDLLDEMRLNGVQGDVQTAEIISDVLSDINVFENDSFLPGGTMMWQNGDVMDGKAKLKGILRTLVVETNERGQRPSI